MFFNEFDILKLRLEYLNDVVDHFIISECNYTHSGKPKLYYLDEVWNDIPEKIRNKIVRLKYEPNINEFNFLENVSECDFDNGNWKLERFQRNYITEQLKLFSQDDFFMISDADEIPRKEVIQNLVSNYQILGKEFIYSAKCDMLYYNFLTLADPNWSGTVFSNVRTTLKYGCDYFRSQRFQLDPIENGGWHFSYFGDVEKIKTKLQSFAHQEFNKEKYLNDLNIVEAIVNKKDLLQRGQNFNQFNFLDYPDDLRFLIEKIFPSESYKTPNYMSIDGNFNHNLIEATPFNPYIEECENTKSEYSNLIKTSFLKSIQENTKLPEWIILLNGMSGKRYRIFINNLIETMQDARYLEIGSWSGSTICSAIYKNKVNSVCIDNWSQFGDVKDEFAKNIQNTLKDGGQNDVKLYEQDFRQLDYTSIGKFNVYFFDGPHEINDQYDGLKYALPALDDTFIFIVDDWNDPRPREGTQEAIKDLGIEVIYSIQIRTTNGVDVVYPDIEFQNSHWHNGYFISVCRKNLNKKNDLNKMKDTLKIPSGATETSYMYLQEYYPFPENVFVSHLPEEIKKSNHQYKILWAHHAYDQPVFLNFDHNTVDHIVSPSQWNKDQLVKFLKVPEHKITVIPNGVAEMFQHSTQKTKTMIFTSIPYKGLEVLSKIIPLISQVHKDVKFKIFSSMSLYGPSNDQFIELYEYLKTLSNVEYSPVIDREELVKHYQESAFFIHPNIWEETFGVSMIEAMKCGAYPIITDIGALAEVAGEKNATVVPIEGGNTSKGWKVTDNFIRQFADACCLALEYYDKEPKFYQEVSKLISDYVTEKYDWKKIAEQWKNLIHTIQNPNTEKRPVYYCMTSTKSTEKYTDLALKSFFQNTQLRKQDKFFLIDNDGEYSFSENQEHITGIKNNAPKTFAENMNLVMKLALVDGVDFFGLSNDVVFTENWNQNFNSRSTVLVPLCNQRLVGEYGNLKIESGMDLEDIEGKENELNEFVKTLNVQPDQINKSMIGFYCFYIPHEILSTVGLLDENFENGGEDVDYRLRVEQLEMNVDVNCSSYLIHFQGKSTWRSGEAKEKTLTREKKYRKYFEKKWGKEVATKLLAQSSVN